MLETGSRLASESPFREYARGTCKTGDLAQVRSALREQVAVADASHLGVLLVTGRRSEAALRDAMGGVWDQPGDVAVVQGLAVGCRRPDEFEILGATIEGARAAKERLRSHKRGQLISVLDLTHGRASMLMGGPGAPEVLMSLGALDFSHSHFPDRHMAVTSLARVRASVMRCDAGAMEIYYLGVARSFGGYFWRQITEVVSDLGGRVAAQDARDAFGQWPARGIVA